MPVWLGYERGDTGAVLHAGANSIFTGDKLLTAPNAGDDADGAMFARLELVAMAGEEPMRAEREYV